MEFTGESLDEVLIDLYQALLGSKDRNVGTRGSNMEMLGTALCITKPRSRLSRSENRGKLFSALGELLWYLAGSDKLEFIEPYIRAYRKEAIEGVVPGAYGPRLFSMRNNLDQIANVTKLLRWKPSSRRAVIQLFNAEDIALDYPETDDPSFVYPETPCTISLQFHLREGRLHLSANLRSNDAFRGLPHDVFCFTMLQEMVARRLGADLGNYLHYVGSMHLYDDTAEEARHYVEEGHQKVVEMPPMPEGDPFALVDTLLAVEKRIRNGERLVASDLLSDPYWADIVRLIQVHWERDEHRLNELKGEFAHPMYRMFIDGRREMRKRAPTPR
ncbi:thymidylate synthase [Microvirga subterranea]|uniref:thymidylate synthase n=1 Tax=Microvirga subterranea TaxID=186651 RepID=A0A370HI87_9HYPH|nr:thymidylate synthase [Microvirga subterranea]RDI57157.1 thymidylate synthase [Microvirga subterranea]